MPLLRRNTIIPVNTKQCVHTTHSAASQYIQDALGSDDVQQSKKTFTPFSPSANSSQSMSVCLAFHAMRLGGLMIVHNASCSQHRILAQAQRITGPLTSEERETASSTSVAQPSSPSPSAKNQSVHWPLISICQAVKVPNNKA